MEVIEKIKDSFKKIQDLSLETRKIIFFLVIAVISIFLVFLLVWQTRKGLEKFHEEGGLEEYNFLPPFPSFEDYSQTELPILEGEGDFDFEKIKELQRKFEENPEEFQELMKKINENPDEAEKALEEFERAIEEKTMIEDNDLGQ